jgi:predicted thioesterase
LFIFDCPKFNIFKMKNIARPGDQRLFKRIVQESDLAIFHGEMVHPVCSTFALARDFEWSSRLFFLEMKEEGEEGVGTMVHIDHHSPAFIGEEIVFTATVEKIESNELICTIAAHAGSRLVASGKTGQKILTTEVLKKVFNKRYG